VLQMIWGPLTEVPSAEEPLAVKPLIRGSFAEALSSLPAEVAHAVLATVALQQLASVVAKPAWVPADISSFVPGLASD
jgi:hypothetical protein